MVLLWLCALAAAALAGERRYAVVIGANQGDVSEVRLQYAERDADRFAAVMRDLGGVSASDLLLLKDPDAQEVREALQRVTVRISREAVANGDKSTLFLYYSGHADASDLHLGGSRLPLAELKRYVEESPADLRLLFVDACRSGELVRMKGGVPAEPFSIKAEALEQEGSAIITSSADGEDSQESARLAGGVFTHHLLSGLQGAADTSRDHQVTLQEAYDYSYAQTKITTSSAPVVQSPMFANKIQGQNKIVLTTLDGARRTGQLQVSEGGSYVVYPTRGDANVHEFSVDAGGVLVLQQGEYQIRRRTPRRVYEATFTITEGAVTPLGDAQFEEIPYGKVARRGYAEGRSGAVFTGVDLATPKWMGEQFTAPEPFVGFRFEVPDGSLQLRARYNQDAFTNPENFTDIETEQYTLGLDAAGFYMKDWQRFAYGLGVRIGGEYVRQNPTTSGEAESSDNLLGHADIVPRLEFQPLPRISVGLEGGMAAYLIPNNDGNLGQNTPADQRALRPEVVFYV
ncbi:MAG: caspase family protein, partial [Myxococcota bacterium]